LLANLVDPIGGRNALSTPPTNANLTCIQSLRGFAALAVCLAHLHAVETKFGGMPLLGNWALAGFAGVDLFFVISGFVMVWVTRADQGHVQALPGFWLARFLRIYPLWWLVLSAIVAVWMVKPGWVYASHLTDPDILRSYLLFPAKELPLHAVGWTLIHEVWFYLVFGLLLLAPARLFPFLLLAWGAAVAAAALTLPAPSDPVIALVRHPLTLEFILGAFVGLLVSYRQFPFPGLMARGGAFLLVLSIASQASNPQAAFETEWARVWLFGVPAALLIWGLVGMEQQSGTTSPTWTQALGNWSYALYLIHVPVFVAIGRLAAPLSREGPLDNIVLLVVGLTAALSAAFVLHRLFERPMGRLASHLVTRLRPKAHV
jgi:exopolysaccharide production protein ExoZ